MDDHSLNELARRLVDLRQEKSYLEGEIERVAQQLSEALGPGTKRELGGVQVRVSVARPGLRIVRPADVPPAFRSSQPDRGLLLEHLAATGEVPPGVEVSEAKSIVYAKGPGAIAEGGDEGA